MRKLLALNRGEIAIRILRAATELGLRTVAVFSHEDRLSLHRFKADEAYLIGEGLGPVQAYLDVEGIVGLAVEKGVDAIHPGYGFLSENPALPRVCEKHGIAFVGPSADILELLGDKTAARKLAEKAGVPTVPGTDEPITDLGAAREAAEAHRFSADHQGSFGGGGRGMRVVEREADFEQARRGAGGGGRRVRQRAVFLERYIARAKHIEVQILADRTAMFCTCTSATARCSGGTRKWSRWRRRSTSTSGCAAGILRGGGDGSPAQADYDNAGTVEFLWMSTRTSGSSSR